MSFLKIVKNKLFRECFITPRYRKAGREMPQNMTILSNNCLGGAIYHELGLRFLSPTINLWMTPADFIKYCTRLQHYSACRLRFVGGGAILLSNRNTGRHNDSFPALQI